MTTASADTIVIARNQVSKEVQDLLVIRLRKHEIEIDNNEILGKGFTSTVYKGKYFSDSAHLHDHILQISLDFSH